MDRRMNIASPEFAYDPGDPEGFRSGLLRLGKQLGAAQTGISVYELPPGQAICPYHYEYAEEEWLLVLDGPVVVRHVAGEDELRTGDVVCFPVGPEGAHKVTNNTDSTLRVLLLSTKIEPSVAVYPDSDKIGVWPGDDRDRVMLERESGNVGYWVGEIDDLGRTSPAS
jgi:uncharacterized cupin superfamily protein